MLEEFCLKESDTLFNEVPHILNGNGYIITGIDDYSFNARDGLVFRESEHGKVYYIKHYNDFRGTVDVSLVYSFYQENTLGRFFLKYGIMESFFMEIGLLNRKPSRSKINISGLNSYQQKILLKDFSEIFE